MSDESATTRHKVIDLFNFIQGVNQLKRANILNVKDHLWYKSIQNIPNDTKNIQIFYMDTVENDASYENENMDDILLKVHKPEFQECPQPPKEIVEWIGNNWNDFHQSIDVKNSLIRYPKTDKQDEIIEKFTDNPLRQKLLDNWLILRESWREKQKQIFQTRSFFNELYDLYFELQRESETEELIVANGMLLDRDEPHIKHPILTRRVRLDYDANADDIFIKDTDTPTEIYLALFQDMKGIHIDSINQLNEDLQLHDYHPLDRNETSLYLKTFAHQLTSNSLFSENGQPDNWQNNYHLLLYLEPCYILRKRLDGTLKAINRIVENVQNNGKIPAPIRDIVSGGHIDIPDDDKVQTIEEQLAEVGGESTDILLAKKANKEQLEIAHKIEQYNAVLVQGPPGTGKTHTIANLLGHFLAKGKSVLVTSYTRKALTVLKDKVPNGLQNLCVSVLDDSNADMEKSVDAIINYESGTTSFALKRDMNTLAIERKDIIEQLADVRQKMFQIISQERNCIVYNGNEISPSEAAKFVSDHETDLSYIPGKINLSSVFPLSHEELTDLYRSNEELSSFDEKELSGDLPYPEDIMKPDKFSSILNEIYQLKQNLSRYTDANWHIKYTNDTGKDMYFLKKDDIQLSVASPDVKKLQELRDEVTSFEHIEDWMCAIAIDGKKGGAYEQRWDTLIAQIEKTCKYAESLIAEQLGKDVSIVANIDLHDLKDTYKKLKVSFGDKVGKLGKITLLFHRNYQSALNAVKINDDMPKSAKDCDLVIHYIELNEQREICARYWDDLYKNYDVPKFYDLDVENQEQIASYWISGIKKYLNWYRNDFKKLINAITNCGILPETVINSNPLDNDTKFMKKVSFSVENIIPSVCDILLTMLKIASEKLVLTDARTSLQCGNRVNSQLCQQVLQAIDDKNVKAYEIAYKNLSDTYAKIKLKNKRHILLNKIDGVAPQWADAIKRRIGVHGKSVAPENIEDAWKWKQLNGIIANITAQPFDKLQEKSIQLSKRYRETTALYAEKSGWYHLLRRTESNVDMKQALQGWKQTVKRIGKGTGKYAPKYRAEARRLMSKCQNAVPAWIMPINKALETLDPQKNQFDVVIIDEASQADISSLAILYMGKKLIIVGDDKQVSPMAVGINNEQLMNLRMMYLANKIPNAHLYDLKTSIYDIAATTFQPLMLREHFRCVPEIIGFSNMLSYDYKIKPLRDASSSNLLPAVINYRVDAGQRIGKSKTNISEAETIIALMQACFEQPEYKDKTFGVISLLGDEQAKLVQNLMFQYISPKEIAKRQLLCGNSANFQGDERDVIFLSLVDSGNGNGPLAMRNFGIDDAYRKRYNVATSRAKDQLWVVNSLDSANDLKEGDIRKILIDYAKNPKALELAHQAIKEKAESPFEEAVAKALSDRGYHLVQQWEVGAYRIDMVVIYGKNKIAIECDGERWHSGEAQIRADMERQTILERLGWRFIRIRGSEYYRDSDATIKRVVHELNDYQIYPESVSSTISADARTSELLIRVKRRAIEILEKDFPKENAESTKQETISYALNPKVDEIPFFNVIHTPQINPMPNKVKKSSKVVHKDATYEALNILQEQHIAYHDRRKIDGSFWIIGGMEVLPIVKKVSPILGLSFKFKRGGTQVTQGKDAWYSK